MSHPIHPAQRLVTGVAALMGACFTLGCWGPSARLAVSGMAAPALAPVSAPASQEAPPPRRADKPVPPAQVRYPADRIISPLTPVVVAKLRRVVARAPGRSDRVFMKVGDSHLSNLMTLGCFAPRHRRLVHLGDHRALASTLTHFSGRLPTGRTSFDRRSRAALGGMSIPWAMRRRASPLKRELSALNPRYAVISFGTNDMDRGAPASALKPYVQNLKSLLDRLLAQGVIPIVLGLPPRVDTPRRARWARRYNDATRRVAESRRVVYINQQLAVKGIPRQGLAGDGVHANLYSRGIYRVCDFSAAGLRHGTNVRNLLVLQALHRLRVALKGRALKRGAGSDRKVVLSELPIQGGA